MGPVLPEPEVGRLVGLVENAPYHEAYHAAVAAKPAQILLDLETHAGPNGQTGHSQDPTDVCHVLGVEWVVERHQQGVLAAQPEEPMVLPEAAAVVSPQLRDMAQKVVMHPHQTILHLPEEY